MLSAELGDTKRSDPGGLGLVTGHDEPPTFRWLCKALEFDCNSQMLYIAAVNVAPTELRDPIVHWLCNLISYSFLSDERSHQAVGC